MSFEPKSAALLEGDYTWGQLAPHPSLAPWVSTYWTLETGPGRHVVRTLPDACIDLTLRLDGRPRAFVAGADGESRTWTHVGRRRLLGARLLPGAAAALGVDPSVLGDGWIPLERFWPEARVARWVARIARPRDLEGRIAALDAALVDAFLNRALDARLTRAIDAIASARGAIEISSVARVAGAHPRTLGRLFERAVGLTPKRFARIVRFQAALRALGEEVDGARLASELGYSDQAHLVREVRALFGGTPTEVARLALRTR
jgi:AraC-like DNA-binding protein